MFVTNAKFAIIAVLMVLACRTSAGQPGEDNKTVWMSAGEREQIEKMFVGGLAHDFGTIPFGTRAKHTFRIVNTSSVQLRIRNVRARGSSTQILATKNVLSPSEEGTLEIRVDCRHFVKQKTINLYVLLDHGKAAEVRLTIHANSREDVAFSRDVDFGKARQGATPTTQMIVTFSGRPNLHVTEAKCDNKFIHFEVHELARGKTETTYQVSAIRPNMPAGKWNSEVRLSTDDPEMPSVVVPVAVEVEPSASGDRNK